MVKKSFILHHSVLTFSYISSSRDERTKLSKERRPIIHRSYISGKRKLIVTSCHSKKPVSVWQSIFYDCFYEHKWNFFFSIVSTVICCRAIFPSPCTAINLPWPSNESYKWGPLWYCSRLAVCWNSALKKTKFSIEKLANSFTHVVEFDSSICSYSSSETTELRYYYICIPDVLFPRLMKSTFPVASCLCWKKRFLEQNRLNIGIATLLCGGQNLLWKRD